MYDLSPFVIEQVDWTHVDLASESLPVLAGHAYFRCLRAVPSLVRAWSDGCLNRQLTTAVAHLTAKHVSPILIESELVQLKTSDLKDENMVVKVNSAVNEVRAIYTVDEQPMEVSIRLPAVFPLAPVEIKDKRSAVPDGQWRAWVLAIQQVISAQNGQIGEALSIFKRNVEAHFEGIEPCAICYSIVAIDRSLPNRTCPTCKNRFHASCLFTWFTKSRGASCPLCRSTF